MNCLRNKAETVFVNSEKIDGEWIFTIAVRPREQEKMIIAKGWQEMKDLIDLLTELINNP